MKSVFKLSILFLILFVFILGINIILSIYKYQNALSSFLERRVIADLGTLDLVIQGNINADLPLKQIQNVQQVILGVIQGKEFIKKIDVFDKQGTILFSTMKKHPDALTRNELNLALFSQNNQVTIKHEDYYAHYKRLTNSRGKIFGVYRVVYSDYYQSALGEVWYYIQWYLLPSLSFVFLISIMFFGFLFRRVLSILGHCGDILVKTRSVNQDVQKDQKLAKLLGCNVSKLGDFLTIKE